MIIKIDGNYTSHNHPMKILCVDANDNFPVKALDEFKNLYEFTIYGESPKSGSSHVPAGYYDLVEVKLTSQDEIAVPKTLGNTCSDGATKNVRDITFWGDGDTFKLISKASSNNEGWMKSTKAMQIDRVGCVVQVTTQQRNPDGSYSLAEAVTFVPDVHILEECVSDGKTEETTGRRLIKNTPIN